MSILEKLKLNFDSSVLEDTATGSNVTLTTGKKVSFMGTINGISVPCTATLREARLSRISLLEQTQVATGRNYWLATGIFKPVSIDLNAVIDGKSMPIQELLYEISGSQMSADEFNLALRKIGFNFENMPLFWQQFGASLEGFKQLVNVFKANGAFDAINSISNPGRIKAVYQHTDGVPVTSFELGSVDRSKSPRNQGFQNLLDAQIEQFTRILTLRKEAKMVSELPTDGEDQATIKTRNERVSELTNMSRQWASSWSGAQRRIVNNNGIFVEEDLYDPTSAPVGRFTLAGQQVDLWTNSARANNNVVQHNNSNTEMDF